MVEDDKLHINEVDVATAEDLLPNPFTNAGLLRASAVKGWQTRREEKLLGRKVKRASAG